MRCRDVRHDQRDWRLPHHGPHAEDVSQKRTGRRREEQGGGEKVNLTYLIDAIYLLASVLFILGLKGLSHPDTARRGMIQAACGMGAAIVGTLFRPEVLHGNYLFIIIGLVLGSAIGIPMARVPMTAMPQRTALSHAFGALAASLVGIAEYTIQQPTHASVEITALGLEVMLGSLTVTGSLIAAA